MKKWFQLVLGIFMCAVIFSCTVVVDDDQDDYDSYYPAFDIVDVIFDHYDAYDSCDHIRVDVEVINYSDEPLSLFCEIEEDEGVVVCDSDYESDVVYPGETQIFDFEISLYGYAEFCQGLSIRVYDRQYHGQAIVFVTDSVCLLVSGDYCCY